MLLCSSNCWGEPASGLVAAAFRHRTSGAGPQLHLHVLVANLGRGPDGRWSALGERAIAIIAPLPVKERDRLSGEETGETLVLFKTAFVFDRAQVAPIDGVEQARLETPCEPLTGDSHAHLLEPLRKFIESLGFSVTFEAIDGPAGGWCDSRNKRIVVATAAPANARLRTPIHETMHGVGVGNADHGRERAEVIVDTATHLVCASVGLRVDGETVPYVAGWGEDGALEAVTEFAKTIDELARRVENVLADEAGSERAVAA
jgi:hypothetical protein